MNQTEDTEFTTVRNSKKKQICKYCKKQGHSISNCWTLRTKNKTRAEEQRQQKQNNQINHSNENSNKYKQTQIIQELNLNDNYICPITPSKNW